VDGVRCSGDTVYILLNGPSNAKTISYIPNQTYLNDTMVYDGPWIINSAGIGALTFEDIPIDNPPVQNVTVAPASTFSLRYARMSSDCVLIATVPISGRVCIQLFDMLGRPVVCLADAEMEAGTHYFKLPDLLLPKSFIARMQEEALSTDLFLY
ncbi:MAG TPA: hypothetical protein VGM92_03715, partial [Candidatus Kapabacteria bacterium]